MSDEQRERRDHLFEDALDLSADERDAFLARACPNDPDLVADVRALLARAVAADADAAVLDAPARAVRTFVLGAGHRVGRYEIQAMLGKGGMGAVYRAYDPKIDRQVALKVLACDHAGAEQRFVRELRLLAKAQHPNVLPIHDVGWHDGFPYFVAELLAGHDLAKAIRAGACGDPPRRRDIARQLAQALAAIHTAGIVHRDLKPANVFLETSGRVRLLDFGIARDDGHPPVTDPGQLIGTLAYMSPEQLRGETVTSASDIYSYALVVAELFTGRPVRSGTAAAMMHRALAGPPDLGALAEVGPPDVVALVRDATADRPDARPSANATVQRLSGAPVPPVGRSKALGVRAAIAGGVTAVAVATLVVLLPRDRPVPAVAPAPPRLESPAPAPEPPALRPLDVSLLRPGDQRLRLDRMPVAVREGDRLRLLVDAPGPGDLYVFVESASRDTLAVLFPSPTANAGSSAIRQSTLHIPQTSWLRVGPERGTQRLWLVWAREPVPALAKVGRWVNADDGGVVGDAAERAAIRAILARGHEPSEGGPFHMEGAAGVLVGAIHLTR
jgi:hypothetical protein